jgi:hypothetical protein
MEVWGYPRPVASRCVDAAVTRIRRKVEVDRANPAHLLTVQGEGYRWHDGGIAPAPADDRCCGRSAWSAQLAWAENAFGCPMDPHDARVGLASAIRAAFEDETARLGGAAVAMLDMLALCRDGWTPTELARQADISGLRVLVHGKWVVLDGSRARLGDLWWPVRSAGVAAHRCAVAAWTARLRREEAVDLLELLPATRWADVPEEDVAALLTAAQRPFMAAGLLKQAVQATEGLLERRPSKQVRARLHVARCQAFLIMGSVQASQVESKRALAAAEEAADLLGEATLRAAGAAYLAGDLGAAVERFRAALEQLTDPNSRETLFARTDLARALWDQGKADEALSAAKEALGAWALAGRPTSFAEATLAWMLLGMGEHTEAIFRLEAMYDGRATLPRTMVQLISVFLGFAYLDLG